MSLPEVPQPPHKPSNGLAVASLVLGILGFISCGLLGVVGLALGIVALIQIGKPRKAVRGKGLATAGIVTSVVSILIIAPVTMFGILLPGFVRAREINHRVQCMSHMRQISIALHRYADDFHAQFPPDLQTLVRQSYIRLENFQCPSAARSEATKFTNYIYPSFDKPYYHMSQPAITIVLYEPLSNHGNGEGMCALFGDGHAEFLNASQARDMLQQQGLKIVE